MVWRLHSSSRCFLQAGLDAFAKQRAVRQNHGGTAAGLEQAHDEGEEEVGGLAGLEVFREVALDAVSSSRRRRGDW